MVLDLDILTKRARACINKGYWEYVRISGVWRAFCLYQLYQEDLHSIVTLNYDSTEIVECYLGSAKMLIPGALNIPRYLFFFLEMRSVHLLNSSLTSNEYHYFVSIAFLPSMY